MFSPLFFVLDTEITRQSTIYMPIAHYTTVNKLYETNNNEKEKRRRRRRRAIPIATHTTPKKKIKQKEIDIETNESFLDTGRLHVYLQSNSKYIYLFNIIVILTNVRGCTRRPKNTAQGCQLLLLFDMCERGASPIRSMRSNGAKYLYGSPPLWSNVSLCDCVCVCLSVCLCLILNRSGELIYTFTAYFNAMYSNIK